MATNTTSWICPECVCKQRKRGDNTETPVRFSHDSFLNVNMYRQDSRNRVGLLDESVMSLDASHVQDEDVTLNRDVSHLSQEPMKSQTTLVEPIAQTILSELRLFREEVSEELRATRAHIEALNQGMQQLADRVTRCEAHFAGVDEKVKALDLQVSRDRESVVKRVDEIEQKLQTVGIQPEASLGNRPSAVAELERTVSQLRIELNDRDQDALLADLEVGHLPEVKGESALQSVTVLARRLGVALDERDVVFAERVGAPTESGRPRRLVVRLARRPLRDELLQAARVRRDTVVTEGGGRVFINERLTRPNRQLFQLVRERCRRLQWRYAWTKRGRVYARKSDGTQVYQLRCPDDVVSLLGAAEI